jgi:hypothetical protein
MRKRTGLRVEELETRATPSVTPIATGVFLPPGLNRTYGDPNQHATASVQVNRDGFPVFLPPGMGDPNLAPPPIATGHFLPPGMGDPNELHN